MAILTLDIGSSSARVILFDDGCRRISHDEYTAKISFDRESDGSATIDAESLRRTVESLITNTLHDTLNLDIRGVGISIFVGHILGIDHAGKPITPIFTYADTRSQNAVQTLKDTLDEAEVHNQTGCRLHTSYLPAQFSWLKTAHPEIFDQVHRWVDFGTYLYMQWFGQDDVPMSYSVASWTGLLNRKSLTWHKPLLKHLGMAVASLPALADYSDTISGLNGDYSQKWPALHTTPFFLAVGDGAAANVGSGCTDSSKIALSLGTTAALRIVSTESPDKLPSSLWNYRVSAKSNLIGGATAEGGNIFQWINEQLSLTDVATLEDEIALRDADSHGLTILPFFTGERSPGWNAHATATIHGLTLATTKPDILQAALEAVALRLSMIQQAMGSVADEENIIIGGGVAIKKSRIWGQIIANALNRSVHILHDAETSARGIAVLIATALYDDPKIESPEIDQAFAPQAAQVARLDAARNRQQALYHRLYM